MPITLKTYSFQCCTYFEVLYEGIPHPPKERKETKNNHLKYCWTVNTRQEFFKQYSSGYGRKVWRNDGFGKNNCKERRICITLSTPASYQKNGGLIAKILKRTPKWYQVPDLCGRLQYFFFTPERWYHNFKATH